MIFEWIGNLDVETYEIFSFSVLWVSRAQLETNHVSFNSHGMTFEASIKFLIVTLMIFLLSFTTLKWKNSKQATKVEMEKLFFCDCNNKRSTSEHMRNTKKMWRLCLDGSYMVKKWRTQKVINFYFIYKHANELRNSTPKKKL